MKPLVLFCTLALAAGCGDNTTGMNLNPTPCGTVGSTGMTLSAYSCNAVSVSTQMGQLTRVIVSTSTMESDDLRVGAVTVNLKGLVHLVQYKPGDATLLTYTGSVTRVSDGASWVLAYDASDASKTQGTLMLAVKMFEPDQTVEQELDLHGHLTATYAPVAGQTPAPQPLTLDVDY